MAITYKIYNSVNSPKLMEIMDIKGNLYSALMMAAITRVKIKYIPIAGVDAELIDYNIPSHADMFDWSTYADSGELQFDFGLRGLTAGRDLNAEVIVYDSTYLSGRVVRQIDLYVSDEIADLGSATEGIGNVTVLNITEDQVLAVSHLRSDIVGISAVEFDVTLPSMGAAQDGEWLTLVNGGAGDMVVTCADSDTIGDDSATAVTLDGGGSTFTKIKITYYHALTAWVINRSGRISAS